METRLLEFELPPHLEAGAPPEALGRRRDQSRLLVLDPAGGRIVHTRFHRLPGLLRPGDLLVLNTSQTVPSVLQAEVAGSQVEVRLGVRLSETRWWVQVRPEGAPVAVGARLQFGAGPAATVAAAQPTADGVWLLDFDPVPDLEAQLRERARPPRYHYHQQPWELAYFQNHFARHPGSAEPPSAGRHFTPRLLQRLRRAGVEVAKLVLHTGLSAAEIKTERVEAHPMHPEWYSLPPATAVAVNRCRERGGRVIAVGTTVCRSLESAARAGLPLRPAEGWTDLYIYPGFEFRVIDGLITGLHEPRSTRLALVMAAGGVEAVRAAYAEAVTRGYTFHEFGDAMLVFRPASAGKHICTGGDGLWKIGGC